MDRWTNLPALLSGKKDVESKSKQTDGCRAQSTKLALYSRNAQVPDEGRALGFSSK
jgi:hypothetical protein